jgi:DNA-binding NtrC family response regulator
MCRHPGDRAPTRIAIDVARSTTMAEILLIEDMAGVQRAVGAMLKQAGHAVTTAANGKDGIQIPGTRSFDLVITDMLMPEIDGSEVLFHLGSMAKRPRVIAMSGGGAGVSGASALRTAQFKTDAFLEKPFEKGELLAVIDKVLAKTG